MGQATMASSSMLVERMFSLPIVSSTYGRVASLTSPYIQSMDDLACSGFDRVVEKVPCLQKPFPDLPQIKSCLGGGGSDWRAELANQSKEMDELEKILDERESRMDARERRINNRLKKIMVMS